jgi:hypothetical protein
LLKLENKVSLMSLSEIDPCVKPLGDKIVNTISSELLTSRNFNCNLFRLKDQRHTGAGIDI